MIRVLSRNILQVGMNDQNVMSKPEAVRQEGQVHVPARYLVGEGNHHGLLSRFGFPPVCAGTMRSGYGERAEVDEEVLGGVM